VRPEEVLAELRRGVRGSALSLATYRARAAERRKHDEDEVRPHVRAAADRAWKLAQQVGKRLTSKLRQVEAVLSAGSAPSPARGDRGHGWVEASHRCVEALEALSIELQAYADQIASDPHRPASAARAGAEALRELDLREGGKTLSHSQVGTTLRLQGLAPATFTGENVRDLLRKPLKNES
jgi:hypothetical protein